ncbi:MAG: ABC transporter ATP-binding protein [Bifidobacterium castoris]|nr:ABC transporter ATP-binding protein [Bifidobacterium castoris]
MFALLGVNGAGKTTTISMLTGLTRPTSGDAYLRGKSILSDGAWIRERINVAPQQTAVAENLTVRENLELIAGVYGQPHRKAAANAERVIGEFGLAGVAHQSAKALSGGMQRRLSIAMALITDPRILFLDEPTVGLDVFARRELWDAITSLKGKVTMLLTTHYLEEVEHLADSVAVMVSGKVVASGTVADLERRSGTDTLEDAFVKLAGGSR